MSRNAYIPVIATAALLLASVGGYFLWRGHVERTAAQAAAFATELKARGEQGAGAATARRALEELALHESRVESHFVGEEEIVPYLEGLEATGDSLGAAVEVLSVGNTSAKAGEPGRMQISLSITGPFDSVARTLGAIEYQAYDTRLMSLALDSPPGASGWTAAAVFEVGTGMKP